MIEFGKPLWDDARQRALAYKSVFSGPGGALVLEDLKRTLHYYRSTYDDNPSRAAFNEGQRAVIVAITNTIASADLPPAPQETEEQDA